MARIFLAILAFVLVMTVLKMVIVALFVAGLIFKPKETVALLVVLGAWALVKAYPAVGITVLVVGGLAALIKWAKSAPKEEQPAEAPTLPE